MTEHIHDCTGPDRRCPCGYVFTVPPVHASIELGVRGDYLINEAFNCDSVEHAIGELRRYLNQAERREGRG